MNHVLRHWRRLLGALLTSVVLPLATLPAVAAPSNQSAEVRPTCRGEQATHVGRAGQVLRGTPGRDVIVTHQASQVRARGGDDLICVTGGHPSVDAGPGDDRVFTTSRHASPYVVLGAGADLFVGNRGSDAVHAGRRNPRRPDRHRDVIRTRGGRDLVVTGDRGDRTHRDVVRTGGGADSIHVLSWDNAGAHFHGGPGRDHVSFEPNGTTPRSASWLVDARLGLVTLSGTRGARLGGLETYRLRGLTGASQEFLGSDRDEEVFLSGSVPSSARMGGGEDTVAFYDVDATMPATLVDGGEGRDTLAVVGIFGQGGTVLADLPARVLRIPGPAGALAELDVLGMEDLTVAAQEMPVTLVGDAGDNHLRAVSCRTTIHGGAGDDTLEGEFETDTLRCATPATLHGEDGDDVLVGSRFDDELHGGPGTDSADGRDGTDTCEAETVRRCEG